MKQRIQSFLGFGGASLLALATVACSGDSGTPTSPEMSLPNAVLSATVVGNVASVPSGTSKGGIRVSIDAPSVETTTDSQGNFRFDGVDTGTRTLHFQSAKISANLPLSGVIPGSTRSVVVVLTESTASESEGDEDDDDQGDDDQGDDDQGDDDEGDDDGGDDGQGDDDDPDDDDGTDDDTDDDAGDDSGGD